MLANITSFDCLFALQYLQPEDLDNVYDVSPRMRGIIRQNEKVLPVQDIRLYISHPSEHGTKFILNGRNHLKEIHGCVAVGRPLNLRWFLEPYFIWYLTRFIN